MAKKRVTRKELLKKEDEFVSLSARIYQFVVAYRKQIQWGAICIVAIMVIIVGISLYFRHLNQKALAAYNIAYKSLVSESSSQAAEQSIQRSTDELDRLIREYGWTKVATLAIPQLAYLKFGQGKYEEAISLYETYLEKVKTDSIYRSMAYFGLAACYEAKGEHQSAIGYLNKIIESDTAFLTEEAMFSLGRVYGLSGRRELSKDTFRSFVSRFPQSPLLPLAKAHLKNGS